MYMFKHDGIFVETPDGQEEILANFTASIDREVRKHDGSHVDTELVISGSLAGEKLHTIRIHASHFNSMGWVNAHWGTRPVIYGGAERDVRIAIQEQSRPKQEDVYTHTGWVTRNNERIYLHAQGALTKGGSDPSVRVELPRDLMRFTFGATKGTTAAVKHSMRLGTVAPPQIAWPMLLATYRAAIGDADFAVHLSGRTGTFKSELVSLHQSHFGAEMDARHLPASWLSTVGALEALAYRAKDAVLVVDDFIPSGSNQSKQALTKVADGLVRAAGNQSGRQRLTDTVSIQRTNYPRCLILSTGEDVPEGHSLRGRMLILDLTPGDVTPESLTKAQAAREHYPSAMALWIRFLAQNDVKPELDSAAVQYRDRNLAIGHSRTPSIYGQLAATADLLQQFLVKSKCMSESDASEVMGIAKSSLLEAAKSQRLFLEAADPAEAFVQTVKGYLSQLKGHIRTTTGAIPHVADIAGWQRVDDGDAKVPQYKAYGPTIGWIKGEDLLIDIHALPRLQKDAGDKLPFTQQTLLKRLKDAGLLSRTDGNRNRNTVRIHAMNAPRQAIVLRASDVFGADMEESE